MDLGELQDILVEAGRQITEGERDIARRREAIADLERGGHETALERGLLKRLEEAQARHIAVRDQYACLLELLTEDDFGGDAP